jgi:pilus assembly protein Flp/PilA
MDRLATLIKRCRRDERGATAIEYGLIGSLVSIGVITWATQMGTTLNGFLQAVAVAIVGP